MNPMIDQQIFGNIHRDDKTGQMVPNNPASVPGPTDLQSDQSALAVATGSVVEHKRFEDWFYTSGLPIESRDAAALAWNAAISEAREKQDSKKKLQVRSYFRRAMEDTRATATKNGEEWSAAEIKIALDYSLSAVRAGKILGRTLWAVKSIRKKYVRDVADASPNEKGLPRAGDKSQPKE